MLSPEIMTMPSVAQQVFEMDDRLSAMARSQSRLTWVLRSLRIGQPESDVATVDVQPPSAATASPGPNLLRVASVAAPHRPTKRNYDYFDRLSAQVSALPTTGPTTTPDFPIPR